MHLSVVIAYLYFSAVCLFSNQFLRSACLEMVDGQLGCLLAMHIEVIDEQVTQVGNVVEIMRLRAAVWVPQLVLDAAAVAAADSLWVRWRSGKLKHQLLVILDQPTLGKTRNKNHCWLLALDPDLVLLAPSALWFIDLLTWFCVAIWALSPSESKPLFCSTDKYIFAVCIKKLEFR